jgi:uncharacterized membrane protein YcaP (DUF421 family)
LLHNGRLLQQALRRERVTEAEVRAAVRSAGYARLDDLVAVVLETDGSLSAVPQSTRRATALRNVSDAEEHA